MATTGAVKAGGAYVTIFADSSPFNRGLKKAATDFKTWGATIRNAGLGLSAGAGAVGGGLALAVKGFADAGSALNDMSARTGASVESLSVLKFAAEQNGTTLEALEGSVKKYQRTTSEALQGNQEAAKGFQNLGLNARTLAQLPLDEQLSRIGERLAMLPEGAIRTGAAMAIFGKSGTDLLPMLTQLRQDMDRAKQLGLGWTTEESKKADALGDRWDELKSVALRTTQVIGGALQPALMELSEPLLNAAVAAKEFVAANPEIVTTTAMVAAGVGAAGAALVTLGVTTSLVGAGLSAVATGLTAVGAVAATLVSPFVLTTAAVVGTGYVIAQQTERGRQNIASLADAVRTSGTAVVDAWHGIGDAIAGGDIGLAGAIAMAGLDVVMTAGMREITDRWFVTVAALQQAWNTTWVTIMGVVDSAYGFIQQKMHRLVESLVNVEMTIRVKTGNISQGEADRIMTNLAGKHATAERIQQNQANARQEQGDEDAAAIEENRNKKLIESEKALGKSQDKLNKLRQEAADKRAGRKSSGGKTRTGKGGEEADVASSGKHSDGTFSGLIANLNRGFRIATGPDAEMNKFGDATDQATVKIDQQTAALKRRNDAAVAPPQKEIPAAVGEAKPGEKLSPVTSARTNVRKGTELKDLPKPVTLPLDDTLTDAQKAKIEQAKADREMAATRRRIGLEGPAAQASQEKADQRKKIADEAMSNSRVPRFVEPPNPTTGTKGDEAKKWLSQDAKRLGELARQQEGVQGPKRFTTRKNRDRGNAGFVAATTESGGTIQRGSPAEEQLAKLDAKITDADANATAFAGMAKEPQTKSAPVLIASPQQALPISPEGRAAMAESRNNQPPVVPPATEPATVGVASESSPPATPPTVLPAHADLPAKTETVIETLQRLGKTESQPVQLPSLSMTDDALRSFGQRLSELHIPSVSDFVPKTSPGQSDVMTSANDDLLAEIRDALKDLNHMVSNGNTLTA